MRDKAESPVDHFKLATVIAWSMLASVFAYGALVTLMYGSLADQPSEGPSWFRLAIYLAAVASQFTGQAALSFWHRRFAPASNPKLPPGQWLLMETVYRFAIAESPAILGLLLFFVQHRPVDFVVLAAAAIGLMMREWPTRTEWDRRLASTAVEPG